MLIIQNKYRRCIFLLNKYDFADFIILRSKALNHPVTNLKLQKILYFLNAIYLVKHGEPLVDAVFEKWNYGPTIPAIYKEYRVNGGNNIIDIKTYPILYFEDNYFKVKKHKFDLANIDQDAQDFINQYLPQLLRFDQFELVDYAKRETQWHWQNDKNYSNDLTRKFYQDPAHDFWKI